MSERTERLVKVLIFLAIFLMFFGMGFISNFEQIYSGVIVVMLILIYLDGGGK